MVDYLENIHLSWMSVVANDVPAPMRGLIELATALRNTGKHIEPEMFDAREAQCEIEIAAAIVGGKEELRKRPIISAIQSPMSSLSYDKGAMEASIKLAGLVSLLSL